MNLSVRVTRDELALADLQLNDGVKYHTTPDIDPGQVSWRRESATSPYVDGEFTISRAKEESEGKVTIEVVATSQSLLRTYIGDLINAFTQEEFNLIFDIDGAVYTWTCEAADYAVKWEHIRFHSFHALVGFQFPRSPIPVAGPY